MIEGKTRQETIRLTAEALKVNKVQAAFIVGMELGEIDGDVIVIDDRGRRVRRPTPGDAMTTWTTIAPPSWDGQNIFGAGPFTSAPLTNAYAGNIPGLVDAWLGNEPGTTRYGPDAGGVLWAVSGSFTDPSNESGPAAQAAALAAFGTAPAPGQPSPPTVPFGRPTGYPFPGQYEYRKNCYFVPSEFVPNPAGTQALAVSGYQLTYVMIIREIRSGHPF